MLGTEVQLSFASSSNLKDVEYSFFVCSPLLKQQAKYLTNAQLSDGELKSEYVSQTQSRFATIFAKTIT